MKNLIKKLLPEETYYKTKDLYKSVFTDFKRDIYSEFGEDFVAAVLLGFKEKGIYVDIGAFRPKELSVTYYFYRKLGWSGILIEPNPKPAKEFLSQRPRDNFLNKGVAREEGELTYYKFKDPTLNSFSQEVFERNKTHSVGQQKIKVEPLHKILEENLPEGSIIDLMNIDVEGLDMEVLNSNDWKKFSPRVLIIEDHEFNPEKPLESKIVQFMKEKGYSLKANCLISLIFLLDS